MIAWWRIDTPRWRMRGHARARNSLHLHGLLTLAGLPVLARRFSQHISQNLVNLSDLFTRYV